MGMKKETGDAIVIAMCIFFVLMFLFIIGRLVAIGEPPSAKKGLFDVFKNMVVLIPYVWTTRRNNE